MEQNFQTSFIPKKPIVEERPKVYVPKVGFISLVSLFVFFSMILVTGGLYIYKGSVAKGIDQMKTDLELARNRFEPAKIAQLEELDRRLQASSEVLGKHITVSPIFEVLQELTMKSVRYNSFTYDIGPEGRIVVKMTGQAIGYRSVALQSDLFNENKYIIDPIFSNLTLDDFGNVMFNLEFSVDPNLVGYRQVLQSRGANQPLPINPPITPPEELN